MTAGYIASRTKRQPAPAHIVRDALLNPTVEGPRAWFSVADAEAVPHTTQVDALTVEWRGLWPSRPGARVEFRIQDEDDGGSRVGWFLYADGDSEEPPVTVAAMRSRLDELINARLRRSFGQ